MAFEPALTAHVPLTVSRKTKPRTCFLDKMHLKTRAGRLLGLSVGRDQGAMSDMAQIHVLVW